MSRRHQMLWATLVVLAACSSPDAADRFATPADPVVELTILGAASLSDALEAVKSAYEGQVPGATLVIATDSSSALRTQIEQGAPADVFLSADTVNPRVLVGAGLTAGGAVVFAGNQLTVIVPFDNPAGIATPADLAADDVQIVAAGELVPITAYAAEAVANLAALEGYPPDFAEAYAANVVSREDNVRSVVAKIELGEGDAGIVYVTDAAAAAGIETIAIPAEANVLATYAGVVVRGSEHVEASTDFLRWLAGRGGQAVLIEFGFLPPP